MSPAITPAIVAEHGLAPDEYERILEKFASPRSRVLRSNRQTKKAHCYRNVPWR